MLKKLEKAVGNVVRDVSECWTERHLDVEQGQSAVDAYTAMTIRNQAGFDAFFSAFLAQDIDGVMAAMTDDPVFDSPFPQPDGLIIKGREAVRLTWLATFELGARFEVEEKFVSGDRGVARWMVTVPKDGRSVTLRGADIFQMKDGKVAVKMTYTKADGVAGLFTLPEG